MRVLITVTTYPLPSRSYDELVCTAGMLEDGRWIRIYPVPFKFLAFRKYQWVELDLIKHKQDQDFRPESYRPLNADLSDLRVVRRLGTSRGWYERKTACLKHIYCNLESLIADSKEPRNVSLAAFRPARILDLVVEKDDPEWKPAWLEQLQQIDLLTTPESNSGQARIPIDKIPYKFKYRFEDDEGKLSTMTIEDWEIGALYRKCLAGSDGDEGIAVAKVRKRYEEEFISNKDIVLFLGTTLEHHRRRHTNPFTIVGVFYPPREAEGSLL